MDLTIDSRPKGMLNRPPYLFLRLKATLSLSPTNIKASFLIGMFSFFNPLYCFLSCLHFLSNMQLVVHPQWLISGQFSKLGMGKTWSFVVLEDL